MTIFGINVTSTQQLPSIFARNPQPAKYPSPTFTQNFEKHITAPTITLSESKGADVWESKDQEGNVLFWQYQNKQHTSTDSLYHAISERWGDFWKIKNNDTQAIIHIRLNEKGFISRTYKVIEFDDLAKETQDLRVVHSQSRSSSRNSSLKNKGTLFFLASLVLQATSQFTVTPQADRTFTFPETPFTLNNIQRSALAPRNGLIETQITQAPPWTNVTQINFSSSGPLGGTERSLDMTSVGSNLLFPGPNGIRIYNTNTNQITGNYTNSINCNQGVRNIFSCGTDGIRIINPDTAQLVGSVSGTFGGVDEEPARQLMWGIQGNNIISYAISNPANPVLVRSNNSGFTPSKVKVALDGRPVLYFSTTDNRIFGWNTNNLNQNPTLLGGGGLVNNGVMNVAINDFDIWDDGQGNTFIFITAVTSELIVYQQAGTSGAVSRILTVPISGSPNQVNVNYPYLLLNSPTTDRILYFDITTPATGVSDAGFTVSTPPTATRALTFNNKQFVLSDVDIVTGNLFVTDLSVMPNLIDRSSSTNPIPNTVEISYNFGNQQMTDSFDLFFVNIPPSVSNPSGTAQIDENTDFSIPLNTTTVCTDTDDANLTFTVLNLPEGTNYDALTDMLSGRVPQGQYPIQIECTDSLNETAIDTLMLQALAGMNTPEGGGSSNSQAVAIAVPVSILGCCCMLIIGLSIGGVIYKFKRPVVVQAPMGFENSALGTVFQEEYNEVAFDLNLDKTINGEVGLPRWTDPNERKRLFNSKRIMFKCNQDEYPPVELGVAGRGSFGEVLFGIHLKSKESVVIKNVIGVAYGDSEKEDITHYNALNAAKSENERVAEFIMSFKTSQKKISGAVIKSYNLGGAHNASNLIKTKDLEKHRTLFARVMIWHLLNQLNLLEREGIIHRDLKPDNILVDFDPAKKIASFRIADFGRHAIEKDMNQVEVPVRFEGEKPITGNKLGYSTNGKFDWRYTPPEQTQSPFIDGKLAGRWSLGKLLWEVLTGYTDDTKTSPKIFLCKDTKNYRQFSMQQARKMKVSDFKSSVEWALKQIADEDMKNLTKRLMEIDPEKRISPQEALRLPCFNRIDQDLEELKEVLEKLLPTQKEFDENEKIIEEYLEKKSTHIKIETEPTAVDPDNSTYPALEQKGNEYQNLHSEDLNQSTTLGSESELNLELVYNNDERYGDNFYNTK